MLYTFYGSIQSMRFSKSDITDLALFGAPPSFGEPLHVGRPNIGNQDRFLNRIKDILERKWLSNQGPFVEEFEERICTKLGVKHCIAVASGTAGLQIASRALELTGEVIIPAFTFIATAHALKWQGMNPVFADIDPKTHNISPEAVESLIGPKTSGILGVHLWGRACQLDALEELAKRYEIELLFDASHAFGCSLGKQMIGNFGSAEVFSFHATKLVNCFEGGAIVTNNDEVADRARKIANFGFTGMDQVDSLGTNGKMNEASAAMGLSSLEGMKQFVALNQRNYRLYQAAIEAIPGLNLISYPDSGPFNYQYIVLELDEQITNISRDNVIRALHAENVLARRYFYPGCHKLEPYCSEQESALQLLPHTEQVAQRVICLPTGSEITPHTIDSITQLLKIIINRGSEISSLLGEDVEDEKIAVGA